MKIEIDIEMPEGYEPAEGKQPRVPEYGESFIYLDGGDLYEMEVGRCSGKAVILKKKAPVYKTFMAGIDLVSLHNCGKYVEIKALEDALSLSCSNDDEERRLYLKLKELIS